MDDDNLSSNLPAPLIAGLTGIPVALVPGTLKALNRLVGAALDIPTAWLAQKKAKIDAQTAAFAAVEAAIATSVAADVSTDLELIERAKNSLVRAAYRKQLNREAVGLLAIEDLRSTATAVEVTTLLNEDEASGEAQGDLEEDWLNMFERFVEDASTERMQKLWGRVLAGELRKPGKFSLRTLRFLSEFSSKEGEAFGRIAPFVFGDIAPLSAVMPDETVDLRPFIALEAAGLLQGTMGPALTLNLTFDDHGNVSIQGQGLAILFRGNPGSKVSLKVVTLTPIGTEVMSLVPNHDAMQAARDVANAVRTPEINSAIIGIPRGNDITPLEVMWETVA